MSNNHPNHHDGDPDWSELAQDILETITHFLTKYSDYIHLRAVCRTWRSLLPSTPHHNLPTQLPWLLLPPSSPYATQFAAADTTTTGHRNFFDLITGKVHSFCVPEASYSRRIVGSSHGFLVLVGETPDIICFNPLTKSKVFLAPMSTLPGVVHFSFSNVGREYSIQDQLSQGIRTLDLREMRDTFIRKVILSASPAKDSFIALAIINIHLTSELAYCKSGESGWKSVPFEDFTADDVIYCESEDLFYAVNELGDVAVFSVSSNNVKIISSVDIMVGDIRYLVKFEGELLLLSRFLRAQADIVAYCEVYETTEFQVYQFCEAGNGRVKWETVSSLGDRIVFVGENSSISLLASDHPGCKGNCIYYTDDHSKSADIGVYALSNCCIEALPCYTLDSSLPLHWAPPIWFTPSPC